MMPIASLGGKKLCRAQGILSRAHETLSNVHERIISSAQHKFYVNV